MNKNFYRIVFNQARGCLMAVAETAAAQGKSTRSERTSNTPKNRRPLSALALTCKHVSHAVWLSAAASWLAPMHAQTVATRIVADPGAVRSQQATVLSSSNGVAQVNIQTPSAAGVSRNTFRQFDVGSTGAILNNSRTHVNTQIGGWVQGNPWLAKGSARVILNEVNSSSPSQLQGYVEVAGQRAEVVIANPAGISVNGAGFINASGVTLTTGAPVINNGNLESFRVQGGTIEVHGAGLDTRTADYTAILSRAVQINAGLWADRLQVVTGSNQIEASTLGSGSLVQTSGIAAEGAAPTYALDVGQLGGMYASKIMLIGTEAGLGVRNAGLLQASSGPLTLTQAGWLSNSGTLQATGGDVQVQAKGPIEQSGTVYSDQNVLLSSQANQSHSGTAGALGNVNIEASGANADGSAAQIRASNNTVWAAGLQTDGRLTGQQSLAVQATGQVQTSGQALATSNLSLQGANLDLSQSRLQAPNLQLQANMGDLKATGSQLLATDQLRLQTPKALSTDGANVQAGTIMVNASSLSNVAGQIVQTGATDQSIALQGALNNSAGVIQSSANNLTITAQRIDNTAGQLLHAASGSFTVTSASQLLNNIQSSAQVAVTDGARIVGMGALSTASTEFINSGSVYAAKDLRTTASSLVNSGSLYAAGSQTLRISKALTTSGTISAAKDLSLIAESLSGTSTNVLAAGMAADGQLTDTGALSVSTTGALQSAGQALAAGHVSLAGADLNLSNSTTGSTGGSLTLLASGGDILTRNAQIATPGLLSITANTQSSQKLDNTAGNISAGQLDIRAGNIDNHQGALGQTAIGVQTAHIQSTSAINNTGGSIIANAQNLTVRAGDTLNNTDGLISARGQLEIRSAKLTNTLTAAGTNANGIQSQTDNLSLAVQQWVNSGSIFAAKDINATASSLSNSGTIYAAGRQTLAVSGALSSSGTIAAAKDLSITGTSLASAGASVTAAGMAIDGKLSGTGALSLVTTDSLQSAGQVLATGQVNMQGASVDLSHSTTGSTTADVLLTASSGNILARSAKLSSPGLLSITANTVTGQKLDNTSGQLTAKQLNIRVGQLDNTQGVIEQTGTAAEVAKVEVTGALNNSAGVIRANTQEVTIIAGAALNNTDGLIGHAGNGQLSLSASSLDNTRGQIKGSGSAALTSPGLLTNADGLIAIQNDLRIRSGDLSNTRSGGFTSSTGIQSQSGSLSVTAQALINSANIYADKDLATTATSVLNSGTLYAGASQSLAIATAISSSGAIAAGKDLAVSAASLAATRANVLAAGMAASGILTGTGALSVDVTGALQSAGQALAAGNLSLTGASLDLRHSVVGSAAGSVNLLATGGDVQTQSAKIIAPNQLTVTANTAAMQKLDNTSGQLSAKQIRIQVGQLVNAQGVIEQTGTGVQAASVQSTGAIDNTAGRIIGNAHDLVLGAGGQLTNTDGQISHAGKGSLTLGSAAVDNTRGKVLSNAELTFTAAGAVANSSGLIAGKQLAITSGTLDNRAGQISAQSALNITSSGTVNNAASQGQASLIYSGGDLALQATELDNTASQILAVGNASINTGGASLVNNAGLVRVGQTLTIQAASVDNSNTRASNPDGTSKAMGLEGGNVGITTAKLSNTQGAVRAAQDLSVMSDGQLANDQGELSAGRNLRVTTAQASTPTLRISNQGGQIVADQSVSARTGSFSGAGVITSSGDVSLSLQGDHTLAGTLQAGGNLSLSATGQITNPISVQAGKNLSVSAGALDNQASGELLSGQTTQLTISNTLTNLGLIDGADTRVQAEAVNNLGTGRLYGDRVAIAAAILTNQEKTFSGVTHAATIAGRQQVDLGVQTLTNRENALIYSAGELSLGGALDANWRATGMAQTVNNNSATIEAAQNLGIQAASIRNTNEHFASEVRQTSRNAITEYQGAGDTRRYAQGTPDVYVFSDESLHLHTPGGNHEQWTQYDYTRTVNESVVTQSAPGKILAGGGISLTATSVLNDKSQIVAGGTLSVQAVSLNNMQAQGTKTTTDVGTATSYWRVRRKGTDTTGSSATDYTPAPVEQTTALSANRYEHNTANASTASAPAATTLSTVQQQASGMGVVTTASLSHLTGTLASAANAGEAQTQASTQVQTLSSSNPQAKANSTTTRTGAQAEVFSEVSAHIKAAPGAATVRAASTHTAIRTVQPNTQIPGSSLFRQRPESGAKYLIETDPRFTHNRTWLGSDYMLRALQLDPAAMQKRLGDGFYEHQLVRDQVLALTGNRFLGDYQSDEQEYKALMDSGVRYAKQWNLRLGIALTAEQVTQLDSDMVWMVMQEVTLADGSKQSVLAPQVYGRVRPDGVDGTGALLAGKDAQLRLSGEATNSGTIAARERLQINAQDIRNLGGQMSADILALQATQDIDNIGGSLQAQSAGLLSAGRDLNLSTTTQSSTTGGVNTFAQTGIDRVAGLHVSGPEGVLIGSAGRDLNLTAAQVQNAGTGPTVLEAGHNLNLGTVSTASSQSLNWDANNRLSQSASQDVGTQINTAGSLTLRAGKDLSAKAATVNAAGALSAVAGNNISITSGRATQSLDEAHQHTSRGFLSSKTVTTRDQLQSTSAIGTSFEGQSVNLSAGKDLAIQGSNVLADQNVNLNAGGNVKIEAAQNTSSQNNFSQTTKSGLMSGGGLSISIGKRQQSLDQQNQQTTAVASTVGSTAGDVSINAGNTYTQTGSDVLTPKGNIDIAAKSVSIAEARETGIKSSEQKFQQSGITLAVTSPVISTLQGVQQQAQAAGNTGSDRMKALAAANAAMQVKQGAAQVQDAVAKQDATGGAGISLSLGSSSSQSNSQSSADNAKGSSLTAGGDVNLTARGAGQGSDITVQGSSVQAGGTTRLSAEDDVRLLAATNTQSESSRQSSSSGSVGVSLASTGLSATASASRGQGQGAGDGTTFTNTQVSGQSVQIESGGDTTLKGAVVKADQVAASVGGNLTIESLQDQSQYREKSQQVGGSVTFGPAPGGSLSAGQTKINSNYQSVNEQSGIRAGDGGFQVSVAGKTDLVGGQITSTQAAIDNKQNSYQAQGGTSTRDLNNSASFEASSVSVGLGAGTPKPGASLSAGLSGVGIGSDSGSASSTTTAGISGIAGNTAARTGDAETGIKPIFNKDEVKQEINAQVAITQEFGKQASKAVGDHAQAQLEEAATKQEEAGQARAKGDNARAEQLQAEANAIKDNWGNSGKLRVAAHTAIGALTGGTSGAVGAASGTLTAPLVADALRKAGVDETLASGLTALASTAVGAATGGGAGAAAAFNEVTNNYLSHSEQQRLKNAKAACVGGNANACSEQKQLEALDKKRDDDYANAYDQCRATKNCKALLNLDNQMGRDMEWAGNLSKHYESKGDPGAINAKQLPDGTWVLPRFKDGSKDPGGFSYGSYQIETAKGTMRDFMNYLKGSDPSSYAVLQAAGGHEAAKAGSPAFIQAWQKLARDTGFAEQQHKFVDLRKYQSAYSYAEKLIPNLERRSEVLKEVIWSGAVQHGRINSRVLQPAWEKSANATDEQLIRQFYDKRLEYASDFGLDMRKRYAEEQSKALDWLNKPRSQWR